MTAHTSHRTDSLRRMLRSALAVVVALAALSLVGCGGEFHTAITVNADGSARIDSTFSTSRADIERQLRWWRESADRRARQQEWDEGSLPVEQEPDAPEPADHEELTEEQKFARDVRLMLEEELNDNLADDAPRSQITDLTIGEEQISFTLTGKFKDLEQFITQLPLTIPDSPYNRVQLEKTDDGNIRLTISPSERVMAFVKPDQLKGMIKAQKTKASVKITLPGEIKTSSMPTREGNTTEYVLDPTDDETIEQMFTLLTKPVVIEAAPGGLDLSALPLDSGEPEAMAFGEGPRGEAEDVGAGVPITEPDAKYLTEALSVTKTVVHTYPGAEDFHENPYNRYGEQSGAQVQAQLYPPRGRMIRGLQSLKITKAVDDQDRPIEVPAAQPLSYHDPSEARPDQPVELGLRLKLPKPDAEAIELVEGEAVVSTFDRWLTHRVDPLKPAPDKQIDLSDVLEGATLTIQRTRTPRIDKEDEDQGNDLEGAVQLVLLGPPAVPALDVTIELPGFGHVNSHNREERITEEDGKTRYFIEMHYSTWFWGDEGEVPPQVKPVLIIRYPDGIKRHRVKFKLEALDLF